MELARQGGEEPGGWGEAGLLGHGLVSSLAICASCQERSRSKDVRVSEWVGSALPKRMLPSKPGCLKAVGNSREIKERSFSLQQDFQGAEILMILP